MKRQLPVTKHEFIFSDLRKHRIARHVVFWLLWCAAFNLLFHYPIHVFKGWDISGPGTKNLQELGPVLFFIKTFFVNSLLGVIVPQIAFTYVLIYWLLPNYFFKKRNPLVTVSVSIAVLVTIFFVAVVFKNSSIIYNNIVNNGPLYSIFGAITIKSVIINQFTSLPIIVGFALMIKLIKRWWLKQKETEQLAREKTKAELQLLKAQIHPHFLFNTLNNIYFFTLTNSTQAPEMIKKLSGMLYYILNECDFSLVPLEKEIKMIRDYMALEKIRYAEQMQMTIDIKGDDKGKMIAPLLLIPFVENSFKHGASKMITEPWVKLYIEIGSEQFQFIITNSKPAINEPIESNNFSPGQTDRQAGRQGNIGLKNVKKRLELLYPGNHVLNIVSDEKSYTINLSLKLQNVKDYILVEDKLKSPSEYAMA